jgi:hypothetical protein
LRIFLACGGLPAAASNTRPILPISPRPYFYKYSTTVKCVSVSLEATETPMKLPALWILAAVAAGIGVAERWPGAPRLWAVVAGLGILVGGILEAVFLAWRNCAAVAWVFALLAWVAIGGLAFSVERATVPANHVARLIAAGRVDPGIALRWRGRLREDPLTLPWGQRFEIDLEEVEAAGAAMSTSGGLRVNFYPGARVAEPPVGLRAGDRVEILVKARPPRDYLDPGAFDVQGFLAGEKIDVMGSLRSGELLQLVDRPPPQFCNGWRARVEVCSRGSIPSLFGIRSAGRWRGRCCWATAALWIPAWCWRVRKRRHITCWWRRDCMWARW